jgi:peroxiredoxin Q/BCP
LLNGKAPQFDARMKFDFIRHPPNRRRFAISQAMKYVVLFSLTAVLVLSAAIQPVRAEMPLSVGATAPAFTLPSQDNTPVSLSDHRGKRVVLFFYPKEKTSGCALEAHNFQRDLEKHKAANAVVIGVSLDTVGSHRSFCDQKSLAFKLLADPGHKVVDAHGVEVKSLKEFKYACRQMYLIAPSGKIANFCAECG